MVLLCIKFSRTSPIGTAAVYSTSTAELSSICCQILFGRPTVLYCSPFLNLEPRTLNLEPFKPIPSVKTMFS